MENQEITNKEAQVTARTLNNSWIARVYSIDATTAQTEVLADENMNRQATEKKRLKSWIPWPVL